MSKENNIETATIEMESTIVPNFKEMPHDEYSVLKKEIPVGNNSVTTRYVIIKRHYYGYRTYGPDKPVGIETDSDVAEHLCEWFNKEMRN